MKTTINKLPAAFKTWRQLFQAIEIKYPAALSQDRFKLKVENKIDTGSFSMLDTVELLEYEFDTDFVKSKCWDEAKAEALTPNEVEALLTIVRMVQPGPTVNLDYLKKIYDLVFVWHKGNVTFNRERFARLIHP